MMSLLANEIRNLNLTSARKILQSQKFKKEKQCDPQFLTLKAAFEIKSGKPKSAARTFTKLLSSSSSTTHLVDDPQFLANLAVVFAVNQDCSKSKMILNMIPRDSQVWKDQGQVWLDEIEASTRNRTKSKKNGSNYYSFAFQQEEKTSVKKKNEIIVPEQEEEFLVYIKKEISKCLRQDEKIEERLLVLEGECEDCEWKRQSPAVQHLKEKIRKCLASAIVLKGEGEK